VRLHKQGHLKPILEGSNRVIWKHRAAIVDHNYLEVVAVIIKASKGLKADGQPSWPLIGGNNDRKDWLFLSHQY
jgi:hypothetical protein